MQVEHDLRIIIIDENFEAELEQMKTDGWRPAPGFPPVAIYPVFRDDSTMPKPDHTAGMGGLASMGIDDSKIHIIRAGDKK